MSAYYNENDKFTAAWLRELIKAGLIADGEVDERSITDVSPGDVRGFTQCHFFAGIGGWSYALKLAGWPDDRVVWTGSCPCQPFSAAGKGAGADDSRDLWPTWFQLIQECRPSVVFGEQVASSAGLGWLDRVSHDMEAQGYALGALDLCGPCVGAFDIRQRLWFVADALCQSGEWGAGSVSRAEAPSGGARQFNGDRVDGSGNGGKGGDVGDSASERRRREPQHAWIEGAQGLQPGRPSARRFWDGAVAIHCGDGKTRFIEPGLEPLAHGVSARVGRLRGYGNAIKPALAAEFIEAYMSIS